MNILMEHSEMRKDASDLRNRNLKMKIVELDVGFHVVVSKVRKNVSSLRYRDLKITKSPSEPQTGCKVFSTCLARSFHFFIKENKCVRNDVKNRMRPSKMRKDGYF